MENFHLTKEQSLNLENRAIVRAMDKRPNKAINNCDLLREEITNLQLQNSILLNALKEMAVPYREELTHKQDNTLVKYFVAIAQKALSDIGIDTEIQKQKIDIDSLIDKSKNLTK